MPDLTAKTVFRIGTRKSQLALVQTEIVRNCLQTTFPHFQFLVEPMSTTGDRILNVVLSKIGEKSLFTKELGTALEDGRVDLVVHSLKDLPTLLSHKFEGCSLADLPEGSVVGTSSLRRVAQLKRKYPHLVYKDVCTRLSNLDDPEGGYAAIILAVAGLVRLRMAHRISQVIPPSDSLHAVSQGALGIECRQHDDNTRALLDVLSHHPTRTMCLAERSVMRTLEGGCSVPIGVNSNITNSILTLHGLVASLDSQEMVEYIDHISLKDAKSKEEDLRLASELGMKVAGQLIRQDADAILAELAHSC